MSGKGFRRQLEKLLDAADIVIDGDRPWDLQVHNPQFYQRVLVEGSLGFGEAYMESWWDCPAIDELVCRAMRAGLDRQLHSLTLVFDALRARLSNRQSRRRAFQVGVHHYDIGNDLYSRMLDERMIYSCAYWQDASTLAQAQENKLQLLCRKLHLKQGLKVLDIGCGWGGTARFMAERYGVEVIGTTVSTAQAEFARQHCSGLPVKILTRDYRELQGHFDRIVSVGMFEHVGYKNYRTYFRKVAELLNEEGLFLLHTIAGNLTMVRNDPWIERYIFPNGMLPSAAQVTRAWEGQLILEDWHNFGPDYDRTLMAWQNNFETAWPDLKNAYDESFHRMWNYYLLSSAGAFRARENQLWQIVLSRQGVPGGYQISR